MIHTGNIIYKYRKQGDYWIAFKDAPGYPVLGVASTLEILQAMVRHV